MLVARGELIGFPTGCAHRPDAFDLKVRAIASFADTLPLLAAWFSVSRLINRETDATSIMVHFLLREKVFAFLGGTAALFGFGAKRSDNLSCFLSP